MTSPREWKGIGRRAGPGEVAESAAFGSAAGDPLRLVMAADSDPVPATSFKVYLVRVATLQDKGGRQDLGWKPVSTFAEMAAPGTVFKGHWRIREFLREALHRRDPKISERIFTGANDHAAELISIQRKYAESAGLQALRANLDSLASRLEQARARGNACLLNIGWAGGFLGKAAFLDTANEDYRKILRRLAALRSSNTVGNAIPEDAAYCLGGGPAFNFTGLGVT